MRFINLLSLFAASHAAQAETVEGRTNPLSGREANKDGLLEYATIAGDRSDDGASSTHGRMLARRTMRSLVVKHVHKWMKGFNPVNLEPSALVYAVKNDELLGSLQIVQWWFKLSVIFTGVDIFGVLVCGTIINIWGLVGGETVPMWFWNLYYYGATSLVPSLTIPTLYALWAVPDQRVPYLVMLIATWVIHSIFFSSGFFHGITRYVVNLIVILVYGFVGWYNWYKVLFPTWTGWGAKHWPQ